MRAFVFIYFILGFYYSNAQSWFSTGQNADLMVSGVDFNNSGGPLSFNHPNGLASNGTNLLMCDRFNNRVLIWNTAPKVWNSPPDLVLGQANFISNNPGTGKNNLNWPGNVSVSASGRVAVTDTENDRILVWNTFPKTNGQAADISIHLPTICPPNVPQKWEWPWGVWTDGTRLAAVATQGSTLLFWNSIPTSDNKVPDYTVSNSKFGTPRNISSDGSSYFFVGDHNAKVTGNPGTFFWNSYPSSANQAYDFYREEWIKGTKLSNGKFIAGGISSFYVWNSLPVNATQNPSEKISPTFYDNGDGVDVVEANGSIYVCNYNGNNVLVYNSSPTSAQPNPAFALGVNNYNTNSLDLFGYIQNPSFSTDGTRLIVTSDYYKKIYINNTFPTKNGQLANSIISTQNFNLAPWDNAFYNNKFVAVGRNSVCVWNNASNLSVNPSLNFNKSIGSATFEDLKGVALDNSFFYLADRSGKVYIWNGVPVNNAVNPVFTLNYGNVELNRLSSDGTYFCVTQQSPAAIFIYKVADLILGNTNPWKTINQVGLLNLPSEAITFNGSLAIANPSFNTVLLWKDINEAPNKSSMIVLGQTANASTNNGQIGQDKLFMPGSLLYSNNSLWVGEFKFSSRILKYAHNLSVLNKDNPSNSLVLYPNPLNGVINLQFDDDVIGKVNLKIVDDIGRILFKNDFIISGTKVKTLDLGNIPSGTYFAKIESMCGSIVKKIIIH